MKPLKTVCMLACFHVSAVAYCATVNMLSCCPGEDTATEARFVWHSDSEACLLFCAKASNPLNEYSVLTRNYCMKKPVSFRSADVTYYKYEANVSDLEPGTEYIYWVEIGDEKFPVQRFKTAGTSGSYNFLWMSDVHSHPDNPGKMTTVELLRKDAEARTASSGGIDLVLFSGDAVKYGSRYDNWQQWNGSPTVTNYTFAMVPGNKEYYYTGSSTFYDYYWYLAVKNNPPNGPDATDQEGCYWFLRDKVLFVGIDSLIHKGSRMTMYGEKDAVLTAQTNWFDRVVTSQRGKFRYLVVFQHDPWFVYAATKNSFDKSRGNYDTWRHVFDKHKVDLALSGDEHNYIRTKPLRGDSQNSDGTIYLVAGQIEEENYSATVTKDISSYGNANATKYFDCMGATDASCGACWVEVRPESMKLTYYWDKWQSLDYKVYDTVTLTPKNRGWVFEEFGAKAHKRYRFAVDAPRSDGGKMQISEIQLLDANGNRISSGYTLEYDSTTTDSDGDKYPSNESPDKAADGKTSTKWLDYRAGLDNPAEVRSAVWLDFCFSTATKIYGYRWYTANDDTSYPSRTPVAWTLTAYDDNDDTLYVLDKVVGYDPPKENKVLAYPLPDSPDEPEEPAEPQSPVVTTASGTYYALSIGVNNYQNGRQQKLSGCVADAEDVLSACTNSIKGLWSPANSQCRCDENAGKTAVRAEFNAIAAQAQSGDTVLYYQSSHGGDDCLCLYDYEYYADELASDLMEFRSGVRVVVVLDTCHSGSMFKDGSGTLPESGPWAFAASVEAYMDEMRSSVQTKGLRAAASGPSVGWVTACDDDQLSVEYKGRGWFTKPFVTAWKADATDANHDGYNDFKEAFNIAAPQAINAVRAPQTFNESLLRSVAAYEIAYHPKASDKWLDETMEMRFSTGTWSEDVAYGEDGRAYLDSNGGEIAFVPYSASTGNVVTVETKAQFFEYSKDDSPGAAAQAAVRLWTNGCFQVWAKTGNGEWGTGNGWVDVEADGFTPVSGEEYTLRLTFDYSANTYSVEVKTNSTEFTALQLQLETPTRSFPIAVSTNCVTSVAFKGDTYFTSLSGDCRYEVIGFVADEALVLSNNVAFVLDAAKAAWLNSCAGGKAAVGSAAAGLTAQELSDAYLLNLDITDGESSYSFEITDVDVGADSVTVAVTLTRSGEIAQPINGVVKFYGAATLADFKTAASPLGTAALSDENFSKGDTATATVPLEGENPPAFFKAKIEER